MNTNLDEPVVLEEMLPMEMMLAPQRKRSDLERLDLLMWVLFFILGTGFGTLVAFWLRL